MKYFAVCLVLFLLIPASALIGARMHRWTEPQDLYETVLICPKCELYSFSGTGYVRLNGEFYYPEEVEFWLECARTSPQQFATRVTEQKLSVRLMATSKGRVKRLEAAWLGISKSGRYD